MMASGQRHIARIAVSVVTAALLAPAGYAQLVPNLGGQRVGISALQFLKIGVGPRGVAMGESFVAVANDGSALFWNPAGLVLFGQNEVFAARTEYVVDIKQDFLGIVYHLGPEDAIGAAVSSLHTDDMEITTETQPFGTGRFFSFGDVALSLSYAKKMTDQFSFGATVRYAEETLDVLKMRSVMVDLGTFYKTGLGSTRFAVVISNFGADVEPSGTTTLLDGRTVNSFQSFSLPTVFKLGVAFEPVEDENSRLTTSLQLNHPNDNSEHIRLGLEYAWQEMFFLRGGVKRTIGQPLFSSDATSEEDLSFGAGVRVPLDITEIRADYAYSNFHRLGTIHRISLSFTY
jgi:hypothetical protein